MCKIPNIKTTEYLDFLSIVEKRLTSHDQLLTKSKHYILEILFNNSEHLSVCDIINISKNLEGKTLDSSTVYRILASFEIYNIVDSIVVSDNKRRYELSYLKKPHYHLYCQQCNKITEFDSLSVHDSFLRQLKNIKFTPLNFNIIINGVCAEC